MTVKEYLKEHLEGKYINGFKIIKVEADPFINGQLNLFTDQMEDIGFGDRSCIKFFITDKPKDIRSYRINYHNLKVIDLVNMHSRGMKMPKLIRLLKYPNLSESLITYMWDDDVSWYVNLQHNAMLDVYTGINEEVAILDD